MWGYLEPFVALNADIFTSTVHLSVFKLQKTPIQMQLTHTSHSSNTKTHIPQNPNTTTLLIYSIDYTLMDVEVSNSVDLSIIAIIAVRSGVGGSISQQ